MNVVGTETDLSLLYENIHLANIDNNIINNINVLSNIIIFNQQQQVAIITQYINNNISVNFYDIDNIDIEYDNILINNSNVIINNSQIKLTEYSIINSNDIELFFATQSIISNFNNDSYNNLKILGHSSCQCLSTDIFICPSNLTCISHSAFRRQKYIKQIISHSKKLDTISSYAFSNSTITNITLDSCKHILSHAFERCYQLSNIIWPNDLQTIDEFSFYACSSLINIDISHTLLTCINSHAFNNCISLTNISFPSTILSIDNFAFYGCSKLSSFDFTNVKPMKLNKQIFYSSYTCGYSIFVNKENYNEWINLNDQLLYNETNLSSHIKVLNTNENK